MSDSHFNTLLADAISALNTPNFTPKLMRVISALLDFDCAVILGYRENKHPIYLYDSIQNERDLLFQRYLTNSFQNDPFFQKLNDSKQQGIFTLKDVVHQGVDYQAYCDQFYRQTGWKDELSMLFQVEAHSWVMFYFGYLEEGKRFSKQQINRLQPYFSILQSLCQQHWKQTEFSMSEPAFNAETFSGNLREVIEHALTTFGTNTLTRREQEVAQLLVQGFDTKEIATRLELVQGTVKNHRKRIYSQLKVTSLGELFQLFLNHLITRVR
ncbi:LuxR family transcriptional regulator [Vibrio natriegens]|uniref:response regulator transcription factor n=1 Tax=Vibrio natriegens TaxID=691 RepID=UPI001594DBD7|nr:helix-turn-helix transcriptional regulator [Vibrio natriegens]NVC95325.1 LuxR family transcriptional regulator [Vibrio natriegens]